MCIRDSPNSAIDFAHSPLYVNTGLRPWTVPANTPRRAGLSAFGFGGTNFHAVLEEYIPGRLKVTRKTALAAMEPSNVELEPVFARSSGHNGMKAPLRGTLVLGAATEAELADRLREAKAEASS